MVNHLKTALLQILHWDQQNYLILTDSIGTLEGIYLKYSSISIENEELRENLHLSSGEAIGTTWAAHCLRDYVRTWAFLCAVKKAIDAALAENKSRPVHLLYAGTGPFAALVLPFTSIFSPDQLQLSLLEINPISYSNLSNLIHELNLSPYIADFQNIDATKYQIPKAHTIDILLSETMQHALQREPQVAIAMHLLPQTSPHTQLIPNNIQLQLGLLDYQKMHRLRQSESTSDFGECQKLLGTLFELKRSTIAEHASKMSKAYRFPEKAITIPAALIQSYPMLFIDTSLHLFGDLYLKSPKSPLVSPWFIEDLSGITEDISFTFYYQMGETPGLHYFRNHTNPVP